MGCFMHSFSDWQSKTTRIAKKLLFAAGITLLLIILGIFNGLGYHIYSIKEKSFTPYDQLGYAHVVINCDITYNPILYPYYWLMGMGHLTGDFHLVYIPEGYFPGEYGGPIWRTSQHRMDTYIMTMLTWGTTPNIITLLLINIIIECLDKRLYLGIFSGIIGFLTGVIGAFLGLLTGIIFAILIRLKLPPFNFLLKMLHFLQK
jgi:hypothetical protein